MSKHFITFIALVAVATMAMAQATRWVDSVSATLSLRQMAAQLVVARVPVGLTDAQADSFAVALKDNDIGGVCFFKGTATRQLQLTKLFQRSVSIPLMVAMDAEWGLGMRLKDCFSFPRQSVFDSIPLQAAENLVCQVGVEIGRQCRKMGVHVNFAPVVDVNSNPDNPVIGRRSFSASPSKVATLGVAYTKGLQSQGVMAVAKHFPGHGDTQADSHKELPLVSASCNHLDSVELYPFVRLIKAGVKGVMTAHLNVPVLDTTPCLPSSLSEVVVNELLRMELGFHGLAFTDGIDMRAVTNHFSSGQAAVMAIRAGNDVILIPSDIPSVIDAIEQEASADPFFKQLVKIRCRRVLRSKYELMKSGLPIDELSVPDVSDSLRCTAIMEGLMAAHDSRIDSILLSGIQQKAYPGCQLLVLKHGVPVVRRCYGSFVYEDTTACIVTPSTMYDVASLTKVTATTLAVMKLVDMGYVRLDDKLSDYLPYLENTNKSDITLREALSHIARLKPFDSYWQQAETPEDVLLLIANSPLESNRKYLYSDLGFILLADMVRYVSGLPLDRFMQTYFYRPMGLKNISFCPTHHGFDLDQIAPTEEDSVYRMSLIHGQVHDPNAYALGGVAGHAGVFASADDVAALMQMLLDGGVYHGRRYLSDSVVSMFNTRYYVSLGNRRALGFDKPLISGRSPHVSPAASQASFGHTGFTGTMLWVDPEHDMVYVFLSNRVYPSAKYNKLSKLDIRTNIQDVLYEYF